MQGAESVGNVGMIWIDFAPVKPAKQSSEQRGAGKDCDAAHCYSMLKFGRKVHAQCDNETLDFHEMVNFRFVAARSVISVPFPSSFHVVVYIIHLSPIH